MRVTGERASREGTTGDDGNYDFRNLPPGTYKVVVTPPKGLGLAGPPLPAGQHQPPPRPVTLTNPSECGEMGTWLRTDSQIAGVLLNADGRPAANEPVDLIAVANARLRETVIPHVTLRTGSDGGFRFAFIAPGQYIVGVNLRSPPPAYVWDLRTYHPGVPDPARATVVTINAGSRVRLAPFALSKRPLERRISGSVVWSVGVPAPDATLAIEGAGPARNGTDYDQRDGLFERPSSFKTDRASASVRVVALRRGSLRLTCERRVAFQIPASWNRIARWLRTVDDLRHGV